MIKNLSSFLLCSFVLTCASAQETGVDLLLKGQTQEDQKVKLVKTVKKLELDDTFLVQAYGSMRSIRNYPAKFDKVFESFFDKKYSQTLVYLNRFTSKNSRLKSLLAALKLYSYYKLDLKQSFVHLWIEQSAQNNFLNSELGVALDQIVGPKASQWLIDGGVYLDKNYRSLLNLFAHHESVFNSSLQAYAHLRSGQEALKWVGKLAEGDELRYLLGQTLLVSYASKNELAKAGKVVKEVIEPYLQGKDDLEKITDYYLTLARLLYQAGAYSASERYYYLIPDESRNFLQARVEALWISMRKNDYETLLGELKSLELEAFKHHYHPDFYLVSAMANLQLCQFSKVQTVFNHFIEASKVESSKISQAMNSDKLTLKEEDFFTRLWRNSLKARKSELEKLSQLKLKNESNIIQASLKSVEKQLIFEKKRQWGNSEKLITSTLRKMRFVKVEFLSRMRRLKKMLAKSDQKIKKVDTVARVSSSIEKTDSLFFPQDGILFGDEVFHLSSLQKSLCIEGKEK
ncbi:MAG: hypothetical protein QF441_01255 [Bacteriovoracaceae bacterium]|jgi:hypothetical protein|nr:hypothetical protein [Halobacteriovoraceae bacterium]MDP7319198.1 hypothetical protein [Bacteriovoracaceae bacterium]